MPVLIVDDDQDIRSAVADLLSAEGFRVLEANNGREALRVLERERPCVIVLDLMMPVMNGWEFIAERKRRPELLEIPVVVVTATGHATVEAERILAKPFDAEELIEAIHEVAVRGPGRAIGLTA